MLIEPILAGHPIPLLPGHTVCCPIHEDDIFDHTPRLLEAAARPASITNWGGDEPVDLRELCEYIAALLGKDARFVESAEGIHQYRLGAARRTALAGPCKVRWKDGVRRMIAARRPELELRDV
jgi:nucleoside-diphosphate-sugar epimerase